MELQSLRTFALCPSRFEVPSGQLTARDDLLFQEIMFVPVTDLTIHFKAGEFALATHLALDTFQAVLAEQVHQ